MSYLINKNDYAEKRSGVDRRKRKSAIFSKFWFTGRRALLRREEDGKRPQMIDRYDPKILVVILAILFFSLLDAIFTLILIADGAREMNPLMAYYLEISPSLFIGVKYFLTSASIILILFCKDFYLFKTKIKAGVLFFLLLIPFVIVIQWQAYLLWF